MRQSSDFLLVDVTVKSYCCQDLRIATNFIARRLLKLENQEMIVVKRSNFAHSGQFLLGF